MSLRRRQLISLGFLRDRPRADAPVDAAPEPAPPEPAAFSLERFYRDRASHGASDASLPEFVIRVLPEDFEVTDE